MMSGYCPLPSQLSHQDLTLFAPNCFFFAYQIDYQNINSLIEFSHFFHSALFSSCKRKYKSLSRRSVCVLDIFCNSNKFGSSSNTAAKSPVYSYRDWETDSRDRKSTRLNSSHRSLSRMPSSA